MTKQESELLLAEMRQTNITQDKILTKQELLAVKLYGENGFEGDIPEIKALTRGHEKRISRNSRYIYTIIGLLSASGIGAGLATWLG